MLEKIVKVHYFLQLLLLLLFLMLLICLIMLTWLLVEARLEEIKKPNTFFCGIKICSVWINNMLAINLIEKCPPYRQLFFLATAEGCSLRLHRWGPSALRMGTLVQFCLFWSSNYVSKLFLLLFKNTFFLQLFAEIFMVISF